MKKIGKEKILVFALALAYLALNIILFVVFKNDEADANNSNIITEESTNTNDSENSTDDKNDSSTNTDNIDVSEIKYKDEKILNAQEYMNSFNIVSIRKTISTNTITTEPEYSAEFLTTEDIISTIDLSTMTDVTVSSEDYLVDEAEQLNFEDVFGFNYKGYDNIFDIALASAQAQGFNLNLENSVLDDELKEKFEQYVYTLQDDSTVINTILKDLDYDKIINSVCIYRMSNYISYFDARIQYEKDGKVVFYNLSIAIGLPESDAGCGCGCGSTDESTCGDDDCTTCNSEDVNYE